MEQSPVPTERSSPSDKRDLTDDRELSGDRDAAEKTPSSKVAWKKVAVLVGGAAVTAAGTVVATLAATHKTAVFENAKAYANGMKDALEAVRNGFDPFE